MQVIDLGDDMEFTLLPAGTSSDKLVCSDPTIPHDDSNLVIKVGGGRGGGGKGGAERKMKGGTGMAWDKGRRGAGQSRGGEVGSK